MLRHLLIATHHGSGGEQLLACLATSPLVSAVRSADTVSYTTVKTLEDVRAKALKARPNARWAADLLLSNSRFCGRHLYPLCRFVFVVREPEEAIPAAVASGLWKPGLAARQYRFRLRRLAEMARENPGSLLVAHRDLRSVAVPALRDWLGLKHLTNTFRVEPPLEADVPWHAIRGARSRYERYVGVMRRYCLVPSGSCLA